MESGRTRAAPRSPPQSFTVSFPFDVVDVVHMGRAPWAAVDVDVDDDRVVADAMAATEVTALAARKFPSLRRGGPG